MQQERFIPLSNKITVRLLPKQKVTEGGIIKLDTVEEPMQGIVVEVGRGIPLINDEGAWAIVPLELKQGMKVLLPPNVGVEIESNGEKLQLLSEDQVLGILE